MKSIFSKNLKTIAGGLGLSLISFAGFSQEHITLSLENITANSNTLEYDLYVVNDGSTSLKLAACAFGVNYNPVILNGGVPSESAYTFHAGTRAQALGGLNSYSLLNTNRTEANQLRLTMKPTNKAGAVNLLANVPYKVGHFKFTNSKPWTSNSNPGLALNEFNTPGITTSCALAYVNSEDNYKGFSVAKKNLSVRVENSPVLNPSGNGNTEVIATLNGAVRMNANSDAQSLENSRQNTLASSADTKISMYPNPTQDVVNIDMYAAEMSHLTVKVSDIHGRIVKQVQASAEKGMNNVTVSLLEVPSGVYSVQVFQDDKLTFTDQVTKKD